MTFNIGLGIGASGTHLPTVLAGGVQSFFVEFTGNTSAADCIGNNGMGDVHELAVELIFHHAGDILFHELKFMGCLVVVYGSSHGDSYAVKEIQMTYSAM